jgi:DNA-binding transcriptional MerR regulator
MQIQQAQNTGRTENFTISQVARLTGVNAKAIRYYESVGLLPRPARSMNHYRRYSQADINRLLLLHSIRLLGVPVVQAKSLLTEVSEARCIDVQQELSRLVESRLQELDREIAALHQLRDEIECYQHSLSACQADEHIAFKDCADMSCIVTPGEIERKECQTC